MQLFTSDVDAPSADDFTDGYYSQFLPALGRRDVVATPWVELEPPWPEYEWSPDARQQRFLIQGWSDDFVPAALAELSARLGWRISSRVFAPLDPPGGISLALPDPSGRVVLCAMPHNAHHVDPRKAKLCSRGHYFSKDHAIANCAACGSPLQ